MPIRIFRLTRSGASSRSPKRDGYVGPMILSASVNADVPAHHGEWFRRRLQAGYLRVASTDLWLRRKIPLDSTSIEAIVFWTRNAEPFLPVLREIRARGFVFTLQYALTGSTSRRAVRSAVQVVRRLADEYGPRMVVWRYDPVLLDGGRTAAVHAAQFGQLARELAGAVDEVAVAFARDTRRRTRLDREPRGTAPDSGRCLAATSAQQCRGLLADLAVSAAAAGMRLTVCADAGLLVPGAFPARCIDVRRLTEVAGRPITAVAGGFMRDCLCARALDIGDHGTLAPERFCGARPRRRAARHDPASEFLFEPADAFKPATQKDLPF
jgi:hypothetical protein